MVNTIVKNHFEVDLNFHPIRVIRFRNSDPAPSLGFQPVVYRVEIEKYVSLDSVQKRREADDNFKFTEYVVMEIILFFRYFNQFFHKINIYKI